SSRASRSPACTRSIRTRRWVVVSSESTDDSRADGAAGHTSALYLVFGQPARSLPVLGRLHHKALLPVLAQPGSPKSPFDTGDRRSLPSSASVTCPSSPAQRQTP